VNRSFIGDDDSGNILSRISSRGHREAEILHLEPKSQVQRWENHRDTATHGKVARHGAFEHCHIQKSPFNHHGRLPTAFVGSQSSTASDKSPLGENSLPKIIKNHQVPPI
jgi:hypothetical protein